MSNTILMMVIFGVFLIIYGTVGIKRKKISLRIGKGSGLEAKFTGTSAVLFGSVTIVSGLIFLLPVFYNILNKETPLSDDESSFVLIAGFFFLIGGLIFSSVIQYAIEVGERIGENKNKGMKT